MTGNDPLKIHVKE